MSRRILVLYTGGTIGMVASQGAYVPGADFGARLGRYLRERLDDLPDYDVVELERLIDSANITPEDWTIIARTLVDYWHQYDGFVLLHGTDTMAATASALSYMLGSCDKPVILTGSQLPLEQARTDAIENLVNSLVFAACADVSEVCICFRSKLIRGNRARKLKTSELDAFDSPNAPLLGRCGIGLELRRDLLLPAGQPNVQIPELDHRSVAVLTLFPGISSALVDAALALPQLKGLIILTYGAGNVPDADTALINVLAAAIDRGIAIVNVSQCPAGRVAQKTYASGAVLDRIGVIPGADLTPEAAFAKLHVLLATGHSGRALQESLQSPLQGDCSPLESGGHC
ncbi:asparaginase [Marinobacter sp. M216]|uniref:asparaginase n=1 Tax=Marinobacter albus TaxID=3030833 RepID=A0ABT7H8Z7_9GAMM|nr:MULTISPECIES: asparaginase [unclassified Marinobacter]MBW7470907.1 asparaginase [Marinobacter sp. F4218]MDK9556813.1 asparaginase [Marinobacter sp. M216]